MNKKSLLFALLIMSAGEMFAQILVGPTAGPNFSWVSFEDRDARGDYRVSPVPGFHAGATVSFRVRKRFFLHTSYIYSTKGKIIKHDRDPLYRNEVTYKYIEIPIVYTVEFKGNIGTTKEYKWFFGAGPNISYWLGGKGTFASSDVSEKNIDQISYRVVFKKDPEFIGPDEMIVLEPNRLQLGLNLATGFVFEPMGYQKIMLVFRYELGHSFFSRTTNGVFPSTIEEDPMRMRNNGFRISLAYLLDTKIEERKKGKSTMRDNKRR